MSETEPLLATEAKPNTEVQDGKGGGDSSSTDTTEQTQQKAAAEKAAAEKTAAEKAASEKPEGAPEVYEFKNPEGTPEGGLIDSNIHDAYAKAARELDLPQKAAQGLFKTTVTALVKRATEEQSRQTDEWVKAAKADSEIGGDKLDENLGIAQKAVKEFGSDGLRELLTAKNGIGNHPEVIRFLFKVGKALSEDRFVGGNTGNAVDPSDEAAIADKLYPSSKK